MSFDDTFAALDLREIYEAFGIDANVTRGGDTTSVRIIVDRDQERYGTEGQVVARVDTVRAQKREWTFEQHDTVEWTDRLGFHSKQVQASVEDDGLESTGVLYG